MYRQCLAEAMGTFFLVFVGCGSVVVNELQPSVTHVGVSLVFGLIVMAMIYTFGEISGAHLNPAVTVGFCAAKRFPIDRVAGFLLAQTSGACAAIGVLKLIFISGHSTFGVTAPNAVSASSACVMEGILTFLLMYVVLSVSTGAKEKGITAGIVVGGVIALEALFAGPITGASMNPARSLAPSLITGEFKHLWLYIVGPFAGALLAVPVYSFVNVLETSTEPSSIECKNESPT